MTDQQITGETSDGFHTFNELYLHRMLLTAALFNEWADPDTGYDVHKSLFHSDGEAPFGGGWFIIVAQLPTGQISYHYELDRADENWNLFKIPERDLAADFDGHTSQDVTVRLESFLRG